MKYRYIGDFVEDGGLLIFAYRRIIQNSMSPWEKDNKTKGQIAETLNQIDLVNVIIYWNYVLFLFPGYGGKYDKHTTVTDIMNVVFLAYPV